MSRFHIKPLPFDGLYHLECLPLTDQRGTFTRVFCATDLAAAGWQHRIEQINQSVTMQSGTVRGLHFQNPPHQECKLVLCLQGALWDVVVDLRPESPTYLHWHGEFLSAQPPQALIIPEGCAHGYQTLTERVELLYYHSTAYMPTAENGLHVLDPQLAITWPQTIAQLSERDQAWPLLNQRFDIASRHHLADNGLC
jgi:dTDP-4-dehydrorhamnose 3,5-epimerase